MLVAVDARFVVEDPLGRTATFIREFMVISVERLVGHQLWVVEQVQKK